MSQCFPQLSDVQKDVQRSHMLLAVSGIPQCPGLGAQKKEQKEEMSCFSSLLRGSCLGYFLKHLSLFTAEETGFLLRCWLGLGSAAEWEKSWAPFESHLSSGIWHVPLWVLILSRVGAVTETVLQIAGLPRGFALQELCCCRACPKYAELPERCR